MLWVYMSIVLTAVAAVLYQMQVNYDPLVAQGTVILTSSRESAFKFAANLPNYNKWTLMVSKVEEVNRSQIAAGKTFNIYSQVPLLGMVEFPTKVVLYKPFSKLDIQIHKKAMELRFSLNFTDTTRDNLHVTKVQCSIHAKRRSYLYYTTMLQVLRFIMPSQLRGSMLNMKLMLQT